MRFLLLAAGLLLPYFCRAQLYGPPIYNPADMSSYKGPYGASATFEEGSYVLTADPTARQQGQLKQSKADVLTVKGADKQERDFTTAEVSSFRIGKKRFVVENNIKSGTSYHDRDMDRAFVALLDSGQQLVLMQLASATDEPCYVIRRPQATESTILNANNLLPYLADRPDLVKLYKANYFSKHYLEKDRLYTIVHSLNTGQPYVPPLSHYDIVKQQALAKRAKKAAADSTRR